MAHCQGISILRYFNDAGSTNIPISTAAGLTVGTLGTTFVATKMEINSSITQGCVLVAGSSTIAFIPSAGAGSGHLGPTETHIDGGQEIRLKSNGAAITAGQIYINLWK